MYSSVCSRNAIMLNDGLSQYQKNLLDKIWSVDKESDLLDWVVTLPPKQRDEVAVLVELVILDSIDALVNDMSTYTDAHNMIMKCKKS